MKYTTKIKIIKTIERILGIRYQPISFNTEKRRVQELRFEKEFDSFEFTRFIRHNIRHFIAAEFSKTLIEANAIDIKTEQQPLTDKYKITARLFYVENV